jgi:H+/gluconate symporter-like permease
MALTTTMLLTSTTLGVRLRCHVVIVHTFPSITIMIDRLNDDLILWYINLSLSLSSFHDTLVPSTQGAISSI